MLPTKEEALRELETAGTLNPGPWIRHSMNVGVAARNIAEKVPGMDPEKAFIVGLLHDIGRRVGIVDIPTHIYEGYKYCMERGWDEAARICMTHSYLLMQEEFSYEPEREDEKAIKAYIMGCEADDYDKLIQLCDALAADYGFVILEKRFVDVTRRYGIMEGYIKGWEVAFAIKEYFDGKMGCSVYDVLPEIGKTTLLTPKPWKPVPKDPSELFTELQDTEWPLEYINHDRRIARAVCFDDQGFFYFVRAERDDDFGRATLIETSGGGVEAGEDLQAAIQRELKEELGAETEVLCKIGVVSDYYNLIHRHNINNYFLCRIRSFGDKNLTKDEIEDFHLSTLKLTYEEAIAEYERRKDTKLGRLIARREMPILMRAKELIGS